MYIVIELPYYIGFFKSLFPKGWYILEVFFGIGQWERGDQP